MISATGNRWVIKNSIGSSVLSTLLANRGISDAEADDFLNPTLKKLIPDPYVLLDMQKGVERLYRAIIDNERFVIIGDYDVDGVTSTALITNYMHDIGIQNFDTYIPHRVHDGYGINRNIIDKFGAKLIITADNGSSAYDAIEYAKGRDIIIIDHHTMPYVPDVCAVINPHRPDEKNDNLKVLCAAGVMFLFLIALNRYLRAKKFFITRKEPDLRRYLDVVALGTVCDAMHMLGINRALVSAGLKAIEKTINPGISAILEQLNAKEVNEETMGFFIGPKLNAAGRLESADISLNLLTSKDKNTVAALANQIDILNKRRQTIESLMMEQICLIDNNQNFICVYNDDWHIGVIGIIAGKLKEIYNLPAFVITFDKDGHGHGSARSVDGVDISAIIREALDRKILTKGGGHKMAAGLSIDKKNINDFVNFLKGAICQKPEPKEIVVDAPVSLSIIDKDFVSEIQKLAPFGNMNEVPKFAIKNVRVKNFFVMGSRQNHLSITLCDEVGNTMRCVSFNSVGTKLGNLLMDRNLLNRQIDVLATFSINKWNGNETVNGNIIDICING